MIKGRKTESANANDIACFFAARVTNIPIDETIFIVNAYKYVKNLMCEHFKPSNDWLDKFKSHNKIFIFF